MTGSATDRLVVSAVGLGQRLDDCESDARTTMTAIASEVGSIKALEKVWQMLGNDALAVIGDAEDHLRAVSGCGEADTSTAGGVLQGVVA